MECTCGNEEVLDAARREFYEETNKTIGTLKFAGVIKRFNREGDKVKGMLYIYFNDSPEEIVPDLVSAKDGDEHTECGYFSKDNLPTPLSDQLKKLVYVVLK